MRISSRSEFWLKLVAVVGLLIGALLRCYRAYALVLDPDEALHLLPCYATSLREAITYFRQDAHPPFYSAVTCLLRPLLYSEFEARLLAVVAGALLPVILYFWLRERIGLVGASTALMLTALAPSLVEVSAEVRTYSLALLFTALTLMWFDQGLDGLRLDRLALSGSALVLGILTDYSVVIVCPAIVLYGFARLWEIRAPRRIYLYWACIVLLALGTFAALYWFHIRRLGISPSSFGQTWLRDGFRQPGQPLIPFVADALLKQFSFITGTIAHGALLAALFLLALPAATRAWRILLLAPFVTGVVLSLLDLFAFGRSRHSSVIAIVIAAGLGLVAQRWLTVRSRILPLGIPLIVVTCFMLAPDDRPHEEPDKYEVQAMHDAPEYIASVAPPGTFVLATGQAKFLVDAYRAMTKKPPLPVETVDNWWSEPAQFTPALAQFRQRHSVPQNEPILFVEGGFSSFEFPHSKPASPLRTFGSIRVWAIQEYGNATPAVSPPSPPPR